MLFYQTLDGPKPLPEDFPLKKWALDLFRKNSNRGTPIIWDREDPWDGTPGSRSTFLENPIFFRLAGTYTGLDGRRRARSAEDLWWRLVYGLRINEYRTVEEDLYRKAATREISKAEFIKRLTSIQHENMAKCLEIVETIWLPWAVQNKSLSIPSSKIWDEFEPNFEIWFNGLNGDEPYPFKIFGDFYELIDDRMMIESPWRKSLIDAYDKIDTTSVSGGYFSPLKEPLEMKKSFEAKLFDYSASQSKQ